MRKNLIIIPFGLPANWLADYELATARELAKHSAVIVFLIGEGMTLRKYLVTPQPFFRKTGDNLFVFKPFYFLPFQRFPFIRKINFALAVYQLKYIIYTSRLFRASEKIFWTFSLQYSILPQQWSSRTFTVYDCVDAFVSSDPEVNALWQRYETAVLKRADVVFANQKSLADRLRSKHARVYQVPVGFAYSEFSPVKALREPKSLASISRPRVCFTGNINNRIDFQLLLHTVKKLPAVQFVFIGFEDQRFTVPKVNFHQEIARVKLLPNTHFIGNKPKKEMPAYITYCDIGFIPYDISQEFNRYSFPMKTLEYFFMGKPVVSTSIPEMERLHPYVLTVKNADEATNTIEGLLKNPWPKTYTVRQREIALKNSWGEKVKAMRRILKREFGTAI